VSILERFIASYHGQFRDEEPEFDAGLSGFIAKSKHLLLDERYSPSPELIAHFGQLDARVKEPMKVAITGQFSSGKSTFLNALLSRNILPTGITPVTSKVNYIRYGEEFRIRVHYKDGRDAHESVEQIARFTDQRGAVEDIDYLTLYAPLEMLREITFVDTPGLNSQNNRDTTTTQQVLSEVDGIIWLSLIDNAGKMSEAQTLEKYLDQYQNKSLCVLNQKDKFSPDQVAQSVTYVKQSFAHFFSEVVPISARQALLSRSHDKALLIEEALEEFLSTLKEGMTSGRLTDTEVLHQAYQRRVKEIRNSDLSANSDQLEASNIQKVLDFIETHIRPASQSAKEYAIKREVMHVCQKMVKQHQIFIRVYDELSAELKAFEHEADAMLSTLKERFGGQLSDAYHRIEEIIDVIADDIFKQVNTVERTRYRVKKTGLLKQAVVYEPITYPAPKIAADAIYKHLFYDEDVVGKMFKRYVKSLRVIQDEVNVHNATVYEMLKKRIRKWQSPYELLRKNDPLFSYIEFANIRKFASKAYENILKPFSDEIHVSYAQISSEFNHLSSAVSFNYQNATEVSVAFLEQKIEQSVTRFEHNPTRFALYTPKLDEIKERLRTSFHLYELEGMMQTQHTFLHKNYDRLMREFKRISEETSALSAQRRERHAQIIVQLEQYRSEIEESLVDAKL
jgi:small GTP-binding protein